MKAIETFRLSRIEAPYPWIGHIPFAVWLMRAIRPKTVVELGVHTGNSFFAMCEAARLDQIETTLHGIDTWEGDTHAGVYSEDVWLSVSGFVRDRYSDLAKLHRGFFDDKVREFEDGSVDLLHIDGLHTYEAVKHDFDTWLPKLSSRAIVMFHDTVVRRDDFGVHRLWRELVERYPCLSFTHSNGLGVAFVGPQVQSLGRVLSTPIHSGLDRTIHLESVFEEAAFDLTNKFVHLGMATPSTQRDSKFEFGCFPMINQCSEVVADKFFSKVLAANMERNQFCFSIPSVLRDSVVDGFRIDPIASPGLVNIESIHLKATDGSILHQFKLGVDAINRRDCIAVENNEHFLLASITEDPQFYLTVPADLVPLPDGTEIEFAVQGFPDNSIASNAVAALQAAQTISASIQSQMHSQMQLQVQRQVESNTHLSEWVGDQVLSLKADGKVISSHSEMLLKQMQQLKAELAGMGEQVRTSNEAILNTQAALGLERLNTIKLQNELTLQASELQSIKGSRLWRWTSFLRG